jgi:lysozyme
LLDYYYLHEGLRLKPYLDTVGVLTIGVGRNLEDKGISESEAMLMLDHDIDDAILDVQAVTGRPTFLKLNGPRRAVLINMAFNLGRTRLRSFKNMLRCVEQGDFEGAAREMLDSKWAVQVGQRAVELADIMRTGHYE